MAVILPEAESFVVRTAWTPSNPFESNMATSWLLGTVLMRVPLLKNETVPVGFAPWLRVSTKAVRMMFAVDATLVALVVSVVVVAACVTVSAAAPEFELAV